MEVFRELKDPTKIEQADTNISKDLAMELEQRKKLKVDFEFFESKTQDYESNLQEINQQLVELPQLINQMDHHLRGGYKKFTGINLLSRREMELMTQSPSKLSNVYFKLSNYTKLESKEFQLEISIKGIFFLN